MRVCDLDSKDPLWTEHKGSPFPTVAEAIQEDLDKYRFKKNTMINIFMVLLNGLGLLNGYLHKCDSE